MDRGDFYRSQAGFRAGTGLSRRPAGNGAAAGLRSWLWEGHPFMLHVTCDLCGKELRPGEDHHYVVKLEVFAAHDPAEITEADLDDDHMEAVSQLLREME